MRKPARRVVNPQKNVMLAGPLKIIKTFRYPKGWSKDAPEPSPEEIAAKRKTEFLNRLAEIDAESVRPLRAMLAGSQTEEDSEKLHSLDAEAASLREELKSMG